MGSVLYVCQETVDQSVLYLSCCKSHLGDHLICVGTWEPSTDVYFLCIAICTLIRNISKFMRFSSWVGCLVWKSRNCIFSGGKKKLHLVINAVCYLCTSLLKYWPGLHSTYWGPSGGTPTCCTYSTSPANL